MPAALVNDALTMAIFKRRPAAGLLVHSDRGSQYASDSFQNLLSQQGFQCSMSRKGSCWDNAPSASFFHTLKTEQVYHEDFKTREEARQIIFEYIEVFYNRVRLHSSNDYMSPVGWMSRSTSKTRKPASARRPPKWAVVVVFPTPPLVDNTAMIRTLKSPAPMEGTEENQSTGKS